MEHPPTTVIRKMLEWICPGRTPSFSWAEPKHAIEDNIEYELRIHFSDDDLDVSTFRQIVQNYLVHYSDPPLGRVVFTLSNFWTTASMTTVRGRLECVEHDHATGTSPAVTFGTELNPLREGMTAKFYGREYYVNGRRHRSGGLPAIERQSVHNDPDNSAEYMETNTEHQYWEEGQPILGPRPWQITTDVSHFYYRQNKLHVTLRGLDVRWMINWNSGEVPTHPLRFQADSVTTRVGPNKGDLLLPEWNLEQPSMTNVIETRQFEGARLHWQTEPGKVVSFTGPDIFGQQTGGLAINPLHIDWGGDKFFTDKNSEFAFMCRLMSGVQE